MKTKFVRYLFSACILTFHFKIYVLNIFGRYIKYIKTEDGILIKVNLLCRTISDESYTYSEHEAIKSCS